MSMSSWVYIQGFCFDFFGDYGHAMIEIPGFTSSLITGSGHKSSGETFALLIANKFAICSRMKGGLLATYIYLDGCDSMVVLRVVSRPSMA